MEQHAAHHGGEGDDLAEAGGGAAGESEAVLAGEAAANEAAAIERIGGQQVQEAEAGLHPYHAAQQISGGDQGLGEEMDIAAGAQERGGQNQGRGAVGEGTGEGHGKLAAAAVGVFLAFRIGVGKEAADGKQKNGAQAQTEPGGDQQASGFADEDRGNQYQEEAQAARHSRRRR